MQDQLDNTIWAIETLIREIPERANGVLREAAREAYSPSVALGLQNADLGAT